MTLNVVFFSTEKLAEAKALSQGKPCSIDFVPSSSNQDNTFVGGTSSGGELIQPLFKLALA